MTALAPVLQAFFTDRLIAQRQVSGHTVAAYRDTFRLLLAFAQARTGTSPRDLRLDDLDADLIGAFLEHLRNDRHNGARTRNARLAAIHSLFRYSALRHPEHAALIQRVLAIPPARFDKAVVSFLTFREAEALLAAPDLARWVGRRDHALLAVAIQTGLRVSELTTLTRADVHLGTGPHVRCLGKGRKERCTPLTLQVVRVLRAWLGERGGGPGDPLFPTSRGQPLSRDAVELLVARHAKTAQAACPTLQGKTVSPHVLRHTAAMSLPHAGTDITVIALWLGHSETAQIYIHADQTLKQRALDRTTPAGIRPGRYRPPDKLLFPVAQDEDVAVIDGEDVRACSGPAGWVLAGPWCACWRGGGQSVVISVMAARALCWSTMDLRAAIAATRAWVARLLTARGRPRAASWISVTASSLNRGSERPASLRWWVMYPAVCSAVMAGMA